MTPKVIHKFTHFCQSAESAVLHIVASPYHTVPRQQEPKQLYNLSTPILYKMFLFNEKKSWNALPAAATFSERTKSYWLDKTVHGHNYILNSWEFDNPLPPQ
jgi:hypothetical protein